MNSRTGSVKNKANFLMVKDLKLLTNENKVSIKIKKKILISALMCSKVWCLPLYILLYRHWTQISSSYLIPTSVPVCLKKSFPEFW